MIGIFDSGFGGLQTMKYFQTKYPKYDYLFLADSKNCPYGNKTGEEIRELTFKGLHRLFDNGAQIVILACNTASAYSIRAWQETFPEKKVLSITIPGVEKILEDNRKEKTIGVLATQATILSDIYKDIFLKLGGVNPNFQGVIAPDLVNIIETGNQNNENIQEVVDKYLSKFENIDYLILGCTHFPILMEYFRKSFRGEIIDPSEEAANKFKDYIQHHPEIEKRITKNRRVRFVTTGEQKNFETIGGQIWGFKINTEQINTK